MENNKLNQAISILHDMLNYTKENDIRIDVIEFKIGEDVFKAKMPKHYTVSYELEMNGEHIRMAEGTRPCKHNGMCYDCGYCL